MKDNRFLPVIFETQECHSDDIMVEPLWVRSFEQYILKKKAMLQFSTKLYIPGL